MKKFFLFVLMLSLLDSLYAKDDYAKFKKSSKIANTNKEVFQDGRAMQISAKENSVVVLCIETAKVEGTPCVSDLTSLVSVAVAENTELTFDPEEILFIINDGYWEYECVVANPEKSKIIQERKAKRNKKWAQFANALGSANGTEAALRQMGTNNDYKDQINSIRASASEFVQITTLNNDRPEVGGKIVFNPLEYDGLDKFEMKELKKEKEGELGELKKNIESSIKAIEANKTISKSQQKKQIEKLQKEYDEQEDYLKHIIAGAPKNLENVAMIKAVVKIGDDVHEFYFDAEIERF